MKFDLQTQLEETLAQLVQIPSVPSDPIACREVLEHVRSELASYNLHIRGDFEADSPWIIATTKDTNTPDILLAAHLDVVPDKKYELEKQDDKLYGRGVYDMKFAAACYLEFLRAHSDQLHTLNIGILFTTDEERNSASMKDVLATGLRPGVVFLPDGGDDWMIEKRAKGLYGVRLAAKGKAAHGSRPWEGVNAFNTLVDAINHLRATYPSDTKTGATLMVNHVEAGKAINQIPDSAWAEIDFRSFSQTEVEEYKQLLETLAATHNLTVTPVNIGNPIAFDETAPAVQGFLDVLRKQRDTQDIAYCDAYGATDARFFAPLNIPCIIIEPHGGGRHADGEWLKASDLVRFYQLLERWILGN